MSNADDIAEVVDEIVDDLDPDRVVREATRLGMSVARLLDAIMVETTARLSEELK